MLQDRWANLSLSFVWGALWAAAARSKTSARQFCAVDEQFLSRYFQIIGS
jgi:hypothetical protein